MSVTVSTNQNVLVAFVTFLLSRHFVDTSDKNDKRKKIRKTNFIKKSVNEIDYPREIKRDFIWS